MLAVEDLDRMIDRYMDGTMAPEEAKEFHALIEAQPELQQLIDAEQLIRQQLVVENVSDELVPPSERLLTYLASTPARRSHKLIYGFAAALLLLLTILFWPKAPTTHQNTALPYRDTISSNSSTVAPVVVVHDTAEVSTPKASAKTKGNQKPEEAIDLDAHLNKPKVYIKDPHIHQ